MFLVPKLHFCESLILRSPVNVLISIFFRKFHKKLGHFVSRCCCSKLGAIPVNDVSIKKKSFDFRSIVSKDREVFIFKITADLDQLRGRTVNKKLWIFFGPWGRDRSQSPPCWIFRVKQTHPSTASERTTRQL